MVISQSTTGEPSVEMIVFDIETLYPTLNGEPILDDAEIFQCEDKDYTCQVNFEWEKIFESISSNQSGIAYRRTGGGTDAVVELDWEQPEGADKEIFKFNDCLGELAAIALKRAQDNANNQ